MNINDVNNLIKEINFVNALIVESFNNNDSLLMIRIILKMTLSFNERAKMLIIVDLINDNDLILTI